MDGFLLLMHRILPKKGRWKKSMNESINESTNGSIIGSTNGSINGSIDSIASSSPLKANSTHSSRQIVSRPPIFLQHGCMMTSEVWVCGGVSPLALRLCDAGYDVWLGNQRGNKYSSKHSHLKPHQEAYWDFSLDEMILHDIPAMIEYILEYTHHRRVGYVGFSQGSMVGMAAAGLNRKLAKRIGLLVALAATTRPKGLSNQLVQSLVRASPNLLFLFFSRRSFLSSVLFWQQILAPRIYATLIDQAMRWLFGWRTGGIEGKEKQLVYQHLYAMTSTKVIVHWFQLINQEEGGKISIEEEDEDEESLHVTRPCRMYDEEATSLTSGHQPPPYPLDRIACPVALFSGQADWLADLGHTRAALGDSAVIAACHQVPEYEHLDFLWAKTADRLVNEPVIELFDRYMGMKQQQ